MNKSRHSSMHKIFGSPQIFMFDREESKFQKIVFRGCMFCIIQSIQQIKQNFVGNNLINKMNDLDLKKINYSNQQDMDIHVHNSYLLPQINKCKNLLNNECFVFSPQMTNLNKNLENMLKEILKILTYFHSKFLLINNILKIHLLMVSFIFNLNLNQ
ncbi:unnamed protein product [Paramecium sonneborni]|uniref:Uncharacterized protein n=1 Tax=Paramecium sonneborni TaxID=65129 RepID=A0A8S1RLZ8_9CILI|nr:unnamed protein product [Paramecium sonneborni]